MPEMLATAGAGNLGNDVDPDDMRAIVAELTSIMGSGAMRLG